MIAAERTTGGADRLDCAKEQQITSRDFALGVTGSRKGTQISLSVLSQDRLFQPIVIYLSCMHADLFHLVGDFSWTQQKNRPTVC